MEEYRNISIPSSPYTLSSFFLMFSFTQNRFKFYTVAVGISLISLLAPFVLGMNLGIDMTGGIQIEYTTQGGNIDTIEKTAKEYASEIKKESLYNGKEVMNDITVYGIAGSSSFVVEAGFSLPE
jgi:preprotein translocase subunit SecF